MSEKSRRIQRVEKEIRHIVGTYLVKMQSGTSEDLLSISTVMVSPDLRRAKVYVSALGKDAVAEETIESLQSHAPEIQRQMGRQIRMKFCPKIIFFNDDSVPLMSRLDAVLGPREALDDE